MVLLSSRRLFRKGGVQGQSPSRCKQAERLCCPFFGFGLRIKPEGGAVWLSLTGRDGIKPFIRAEIGQALPAGMLEP